MNHYKHYSFDLWLTLIRSNPAFKEQRTLYFHKNLNEKRKPVDEVAQIFRKVDLMCNAINERTQKNIDADEMYLIVIRMIHDHDIDLQQLDLTSLYADMEQLVFDYLPHTYSPDTIPVIKQLKSKQNTTLSILSNTGFIKGTTLRKVLKELGLYDFFDFQLYSDEEGLSKPSKQLFERVIDESRKLHKTSLMTNEIIHIGDNPVADIEGAYQVGINSILINTGNGTITDLINYDKNLCAS